ncbi:MAG: hypothetical protein RLZZ299_611 [Pseudomonadota bacterium]|jgi:hypothetical protein
MIAMALLGLLACGIPDCEDFCTRRTACVADTVAEAGATWQDWTGFADAASYEAACLAPFQDSLEAGASRGEIQRLCVAEAADLCDAE